MIVILPKKACSWRCTREGHPTLPGERRMEGRDRISELTRLFQDYHMQINTLPPSAASYRRTFQLMELTPSISPWLLERAAHSCAQMIVSSFSPPASCFLGLGPDWWIPEGLDSGSSGPLLGVDLPAVKGGAGDPWTAQSWGKLSGRREKNRSSRQRK